MDHGDQPLVALKRLSSYPAEPWMLYSISTSACTSSAGGTVIPRLVAVFKLIAKVKRVGFSNGNSAGLAPLRIWSTNAAPRSALPLWSGPYDISPPSRQRDSNS